MRWCMENSNSFVWFQNSVWRVSVHLSTRIRYVTVEWTKSQLLVQWVESILSSLNLILVPHPSWKELLLTSFLSSAYHLQRISVDWSDSHITCPSSKSILERQQAKDESFDYLKIAPSNGDHRNAAELCKRRDSDEINTEEEGIWSQRQQRSFINHFTLRPSRTYCTMS